MEEPNYIALIKKHLADDISSDEQKILDAWLEKEENKKTLENYKLIWMEEREKEGEIAKPNKKRMLLNIGVILALLIAFFIVLQYSSKKKNDDTMVVSTMNETKDATLPDGSKVWLNENSEIIYSNNFEVRDVLLDGEAFFEVRKNPAHPFSVYSQGTQTIASGGSFNIFSNNETLEVNAATDSVTFIPIEKQAKHTHLNKEEMVALNFSSGEVTKSPSDLNFLSWKTNKLNFDNTSLHEITMAFEEYFNVPLEVPDSSLYEKRFSGSFDAPKIDDFLVALTKELELSYERKQGGFVLMSNSD